MEIQSFVLGAYQTNAYLLIDESRNEAIVIDPGYEPAQLLRSIEGLNVTRILLTHAHLDHIGGLRQVKEMTKAPIYIHKIEKEWLTNPKLNGSQFAPFGLLDGPPADFFVEEGDTFSFAGHDISVVFVPGHTPGHVVYVWDGHVLAGDTLFDGSIGRTDLAGGDFNTLITNIQEKLYSLPEDTIVLPGHGGSTTIGKERKTNPFVRDGYVYEP